MNVKYKHSLLQVFIFAFSYQNNSKYMTSIRLQLLVGNPKFAVAFYTAALNAGTPFVNFCIINLLRRYGVYYRALSFKTKYLSLGFLMC